MGDDVGPMHADELVNAVISGRVNYDTFVRRDDCDNWIAASSVKGLFNKAQSIQQKQEELNSRLEADLAEQARLNEAHAENERQRFNRITVSTCSPPQSRVFEILDTVFAIDSDGSAGMFSQSDGDPNVAFFRVKDRLRQTAFEMGADAVINCQFEYRVAVVANRTGEAIGNMLTNLTGTVSHVGA